MLHPGTANKSKSLPLLPERAGARKSKRRVTVLAVISIAFPPVANGAAASKGGEGQADRTLKTPLLKP